MSDFRAMPLLSENSQSYIVLVGTSGITEGCLISFAEYELA
jgi:hypothetical protein